jgi:hypothetical protein
MAITAYKFDCFVADMGNKVHNLGSDTLKIALTNTAPVETNTTYTTQISTNEVAGSYGYTTGGAAVGSNTFAQASGLATLFGSSVLWTASGGNIGPYRYAVLYNSTASGKNLIAWLDFGAAQTITSGNTGGVQFDPTQGILTVQ